MLRGPEAILLVSCDTCSDSIAKLCSACFGEVSRKCRAISCRKGYRTDMSVQIEVLRRGYHGNLNSWIPIHGFVSNIPLRNVALPLSGSLQPILGTTFAAYKVKAPILNPITPTI